MRVRNLGRPHENAVMVFRDHHAVLGSRGGQHALPPLRIPALGCVQESSYEDVVLAVSPHPRVMLGGRGVRNADGVPIPLGVRRVAERHALALLAGQGEGVLAGGCERRHRTHGPMGEDPELGIQEPRRDRVRRQGLVGGLVHGNTLEVERTSPERRAGRDQESWADKRSSVRRTNVSRSSAVSGRVVRTFSST